MKWVLFVVAALIGLIILTALIGAALPRNHVAGASVTLHQPADSIWKVVRDLGGVPQWWPEMRASERAKGPDGWEHWRQTLSGNGMTIVIEAVEPPRRLVTRIESPPGAPFGGSWIYEITPTPDGGGSKVTVIEQGWIANPIFRFMSRFVFGYYGTQESYLRALGKRFGETVMPVREPSAHRP